MLKKQTVWLLTLLSLMIVLSVFYMNSPEADDFSFIFQEDTEQATESSSNDLTELTTEQPLEFEVTELENSEITDVGDLDTSSISTDDDHFTFIRMELTESRSSQIEKLESVVASSTATSDEKNNAYEEIKVIDQLSSKELIVEHSLKDEYGYPDVLVRSMDEHVIITIKTDELSEKEANQIMRTVYDEFGPMQVKVKFQPANI